MSEVSVIKAAAAERDQWDGFLQFVTWETAVGGPDPHMAVTGHIGRDLSRRDRAWLGLCYIGFYNVPTAEIFNHFWPLDTALAQQDELRPWIEANWKGLAFRRERRPARTPSKLAAYFRAAAQWADEATEFPWMNEPGSYEDAWRDIQEIPYLGRYVALKTIEYLKRYCGAQVTLPDMRPKGGWSPRTALALLHPDFAERLMGDDSAANINTADSLFEETSAYLEEVGKPLSNYNLQVLLCDYKQCYVGRRQFPGRSQDSEIMYADKVMPHWPVGYELKMWDARAELFPHEALGEKQGWRRVREELGLAWRDYNYMWSDLRFDYLKTLDVSVPEERVYV